MPRYGALTSEGWEPWLLHRPSGLWLTVKLDFSGRKRVSSYPPLRRGGWKVYAFPGGKEYVPDPQGVECAVGAGCGTDVGAWRAVDPGQFVRM
jgi:hypothetical protein